LTMKLLVLWNLTSPCLRVHKVIGGFKQGVAGVGGICLLLSIVLNVLPYVVNMVILGSTQPFLIPAFLIFNVSVLLLVKACVHKDFRNWKIEEIVNHGFCATLFVVTSKPTPSTMTKDSVREVIFYYGLNLIHWVMSITLYQVFPELLQKCEKMRVPVETQMVIYLVPPLCILLSALFRAAYHMKDAWAFGRQRSCKTIGNALLRVPQPKSALTQFEFEERGVTEKESEPETEDKSQATDVAESSSVVQSTGVETPPHKGVAIEIGNIFEQIRSNKANEKN